MISFTKKNEKYACFSNFYKCKVIFDGLVFSSSEAAWQSQKTSHKIIRKIFQNKEPAEAKKLGRQVPLRSNWEDIKYQLMVDVCYAKFSQNNDLKQILLSTNQEELVENTTGWHDNIWGNCDCPRCQSIKGQNLLGKALMEVREKLRSEAE
jgi:ribA/ribD-fused uncharacterized protein